MAEVAGLPRVQGQGLSQPSLRGGAVGVVSCPSSRLVVSGSSLATAFALIPTELVAWVPGWPLLGRGGGQVTCVSLKNLVLRPWVSFKAFAFWGSWKYWLAALSRGR